MFSKIKYKNNLIFSINEEIIDDNLVHFILKNTQNDKKIGLNMEHVKNISSPLFIKCLIENKFKLYNLKSELLAFLAIVLKEGSLKTFMNYEDFNNNKRELIKRRFLIA